jgi:hypothetical protein
MIPQYLAAYYRKQYTKSQLADLLAEVILSGQVPDVPDIQGPQPYAPLRGRPSKEEQAERQAALIVALETSWPREVTTRDLAVQVGMHYSTIERLQTNADFIEQLKPFARDYFRQRPTGRAARLPAWWRAILTIHFYTLARAALGTRLPLYSSHSLLWVAGNKINADLKHQRDRDFVEWTSLWGHTPIFEAAGWDKLAYPYQSWTGVGLSPPCADGCPIVEAYYDLSHPAHNSVAAARQLLDPEQRLPWGTQLLDQPGGGYQKDILKQLIGEI